MKTRNKIAFSLLCLISMSMFLFLTITRMNLLQEYEHRNKEGNGLITKVNYTLSHFTGIKTEGNIQVYVVEGDYGIQVEVDDNLQALLTPIVKDGIVEVVPEEGYQIHASQAIKLYVQIPGSNLEKIQVSEKLPRSVKPSQKKSL